MSRVIKTDFTIKRCFFDECLAAIREGYESLSKPDIGEMANGIMNSQTLTMALEISGWKAFLNADGDIIGMDFTGTDVKSQRALFGLIAPYVENGSSIITEDTDGCVAWLFDNGKCSERRS